MNKISPELTIDMTAIPLRPQIADATSSERNILRINPAGTAPLDIDNMARLLRAVSRACPDRGSHIVQVISAEHGEGVSSVARALAYTATVIDGAAALVCDASADRDTVRRFGRSGDMPSLSDMIGRPGDLASAISPVPSLNYAVCALSGAAMTTHQDAKTDRLGKVLDLLRGAFDWIIIDTAPISDGSFGPTLSRLCDGTILVAQAGQTRRSAVADAQRTLDLYGGRVLGVVVNKVNRDPGSGKRPSRWWSRKSA
jgi:Mrp family chromosome partitioning ATPase